MKVDQFNNEKLHNLEGFQLWSNALNNNNNNNNNNGIHNSISTEWLFICWNPSY